MNFDARAAKALAPGNHLIFNDYPGLRFVVSNTRRTWIYRYKSPIDSRMRQISIGHWPALSFPGAIVAWEALRIKRDSGIDPALESKQAKSKPTPKIDDTPGYTVRQLCNDYLNGHIYVNRCKQGATDLNRLLTTKLIDIEALSVDAITRSIAFDVISQLAAASPVQASKLRQELAAAWDFALDAGRIPETTVNWWRLILKGKIKSKGKTQNGINVGTAKRVLTDDELGELINWLPNFPINAHDALLMYLWTATRGAEILAMTGSEVAEESSGWVWTIPKIKTKSARHQNAVDHRVPLVGRALSMVQRRKKQHGEGYLFPLRNGRGHVSQHTLSVRVYEMQPYSMHKKYINRLPVTNWAPHDLRRTSRTILAKLGCPDAVAESILGHVIPGVAGVYNRYQYDEEKRVWLINLSDYLEGLVAG